MDLALVAIRQRALDRARIAQPKRFADLRATGGWQALAGTTRYLAEIAKQTGSAFGNGRDFRAIRGLCRLPLC
jgi:hypothetical protein